MNSGTKIKEMVYTEGDETYYVKPGDGEKLLYVSENHVDHAENWIIRYNVDGVEMVRWNTRYLLSIESDLEAINDNENT